LRERGQRSVFTLDPKSELYRLTAGAAGRHLQVWRFAPTEPTASHCYNPLAYVERMEDAQDLARAWIINTGQSSNPFFDRNMELLITATVLHLRAAEPAAPLSRLTEIFSMPPARLITLFDHSPSKAAKTFASQMLNGMSGDPRLVGGLVTDLAGRFLLLHDPDLQAVTSASDINFRAMSEGKKPIALYLNIPASQADRLKPLSALFLMQMFKTWIRQAERNGGQLARAVCCYLDEFANAGRIPDFERHITMLRSMRVALLVAVQNFSQLDYVYGVDIRPTILANATTHIVLPGCGLEETEMYSARIGDTTVQARSAGQSFQPVPIINVLSGRSQNSSEQRRRLITADEIRTMAGLLIVQGAAAPMQLTPLPFYRDPQLKMLANLPAPTIAPAPILVQRAPAGPQPGTGNTGPQSLLP
jgi:type IV secretion system protein VirD4